MKDKKYLELIKLNGNTYIIEGKCIDHDSNGNQDVEIGESVIDVYEGIVGQVSHIGGAWDFKGTLQFPSHCDLHQNRHCTFHCRKIIASTNNDDGSIELKITKKLNRDVSGRTIDEQRIGS